MMKTRFVSQTAHPGMRFANARVARAARLEIGFGLWEANDLARLFPLAALLQQLDAFEPFQDIALGRDRAGAF
jgi:hypothetical protein